MAARERLLTLRLNAEEHRRFEAVAKDMGLNIAGMLRALVREREKKNAPLRFIKPGHGLKVSR